ncbi:hypothetical protein GA0115256_135318 [Streptomyces sp. DconLS]|nr:hypothetical protein GA0115258_106018 [Streptomyces sp. LamerLS-31b]SCF94402.1 hypothetical protein GA0115256_135318 [Streptomyces sp. DconLS]
MMLALSASACGAGDDAARNPGITASQVCGSTLDSSGAAALRRMAGTDKFDRFSSGIEGTDLFGKTGSSSAQNSAGGLRDFTSGWECYISKADDTTDPPLINVKFTAQSFTLKEEQSSKKGEAKEVYYPIGTYARTAGRSSADIFFACPTRATGKGSKSTPYIEGELTAGSYRVSLKTTARDPMVILNPIARGVAKQLGCLSQANLPADIPRV